MSLRYSEWEAAGHWVLCAACQAPVPPTGRRVWDGEAGLVYCNLKCHRFSKPSIVPSANSKRYGTGVAAFHSLTAERFTCWYGCYGAPYLLPFGVYPADVLQGAYVQAWVWIDLAAEQGQMADAELRQLARRRWQEDGSIEIDDDARVSRSYVGG